MIVTFCGHRDFRDKEKYRKKLLTYLEEKIGDAPVDFYLGGYGAFDEFAYECCKKYQLSRSNATLIFVTPYMTLEYQKNHLEYLKTIYDAIIYPEIEDKLPRFAISYRNRWMVEKADFVIAYIDHTYGGAYKTYQHAKQKGKTIFNISNRAI